jgi:hypothetical protein
MDEPCDISFHVQPPKTKCDKQFCSENQLVSNIVMGAMDNANALLRA